MLKGLIGWLALCVAGCTSQGQIEIVLDKPDSERLVRFYFGSYVGRGEDPLEAGMVRQRGSRFFVDPAALEALHPGLGSELMRRTRRGVLSWDSLGSFLAATYYEARQLPQTVEDFRARWSYTGWPSFEVDGPMTRARRRIFVRDAAIRAALTGYEAAGGRLLYPEGTAIIADHYLDGTLVEHTAMVRRSDGFWDFATYAANGALKASTQALPRALKTPLQCVGCHFGSKLFEPERSFPLPASAPPEGLRAYHVNGDARDPEVVRYFAEHARRSDTILGVYGSIYVARLRSGRDTLSATNRALLAKLGL